MLNTTASTSLTYTSGNQSRVFDIMRFRSLLRMAWHENSNSFEAEAAFRRAGVLLSNSGKNIDDLTFDVADQTSDINLNSIYIETIHDLQSIVEIKDEMIRLVQDKLAEYSLRIETLEEANAALLKKYDIHGVDRGEGLYQSATESQFVEHSEAFSANVSECRENKSPKYVKFSDIEEIVVSKTNRKHWKSIIAFHLGISMKDIKAWAHPDLFPSCLASKIKNFSKQQFSCSSRKKWEKHEISMLKKSLEEGLSDLGVAKYITDNTGRLVYETTVTRIRRSLYKTERWKPSHAEDRSKHHIV